MCAGPEKLQPVIERTYREYPNFCRAMARRADQYNTCREPLFQLEREGRVLVLAPVSTHKVSRVERDTKKLRMLWGDGYQQAVDRMDEIRAFLTRTERDLVPRSWTAGLEGQQSQGVPQHSEEGGHAAPLVHVGLPGQEDGQQDGRRQKDVGISGKHMGQKRPPPAVHSMWTAAGRSLF